MHESQPTAPNAQPRATFSSSRVSSLDVLRGLAILLMIFSGLLPKTMPNWFDHGYNAHYLLDATGKWTLRPEVTAGGDLFLPGWMAFTWVDLVFPAFLFCMGAALPLSLSKRLIEVGGSKFAVVRTIIGRWLVLVVFSAAVRYLNIAAFPSPNADTARLITIGAFLVASLFFIRWPDTVPKFVVNSVRTLALAGMSIRILATGVRYDEPFKWGDPHTDIIILVLATTYAVASLLWLWTPRRQWGRLVLILPVMLLAHYVQFADPKLAGLRWMGDKPLNFFAPIHAWGTHALELSAWLPGLRKLAVENAWLRNFFDFRGLWDFSWLKFLWVVVPGTIVGDWLRTWSQRRTIESGLAETDGQVPSSWSLPLAALVCVGAFVGLRNFGFPLFGVGGPLRTPFLALLLAVPPLVMMGYVVLPRAYGHLWISRRLYKAGAAFTLLGLLLACVPFRHAGGDFFERGISKGPPATLSYYLLSAGLCHLLLLGLLERLDYRHRPLPGSELLRRNGQNALMAYYIAHTVAGAVLSLSIFAMFTPEPAADSIASTLPTTLPTTALAPPVVASINALARQALPGMWGQALWAAMVTLGIAITVWFFTKMRLYWRA